MAIRRLSHTRRAGPRGFCWATLPFPVHPHMLRHACGFKLAHDGVDTRALQEWLGHRNIQHTTRYIELTSSKV